MKLKCGGSEDKEVACGQSPETCGWMAFVGGGAGCGNCQSEVAMCQAGVLGDADWQTGCRPAAFLLTQHCSKKFQLPAQIEWLKVQGQVEG